MTTGHRSLVLVGLAVVGIGAADRDLRLVTAAKYGDSTALRALLEQGADVTAPEGDGTTALHWAAYRDDAESVDFLIRAGAQVNVANDLGITPLWAACENGSPALVRRLLQAGANPNVALPSGETPLMTAARSGNVDVVAQLLAKGADPNAKERVRGQTSLMWAVAQQHSNVVAALLAHGGDLRARSDVWTQVVRTAEEMSNPSYIFEIQQGGYTPLLFAARVGELASAKLLVAAGADVNDTAPYGTSATVVAAHSGHGELAAFLLEQGADPNAAAAGYTALHAAILHKDDKLVEALLHHGANPNAALLSGTPNRGHSIDFYLHPAFVNATPFWLAARFRTPRIMRLLADHGADPMSVHRPAYWRGTLSGDGNKIWLEEGQTTALMAAAGMGGPSPLVAVDRLGRLAENARQVGGPEVGELEAITLEAVKTAAEIGVDVNGANADGNTALHAVAAAGYNTVVTFLVEKGAKLDLRNKEGQSPLGAAMAGSLDPGPRRKPSPRESTVELLRKFGAPE